MKFYKLITTMFILVASLGFTLSDAFDYDNAWKEVDEALSKGLPKTALVKINEIYDYAVKDNNPEQQVKATMSGAKLTLDTEELGLEEVVSILKSRTETAKTPTKQLLHSLTADLFHSYYQNQYYKISQRTNLVSFNTGDIRTWAPNNYRDFIAEQYLISISDEIKSYLTKDYKKLLTNDKALVELRPTLYDLLVDKALKYFSNKDYRITSSFDFEIDDKQYFSKLDDFIDLEIPIVESSKLNQAIHLFQNQLQRHSDNKDKEVLASYDLKRLDFVMSIGTMANKKECYEEGLQQGINYHNKRDAHPFIIKLAQSYVNTQRYKEGELLLEKLNDTEQHIEAQKKNLINKINQKQLNLVSEKVVSKNTSFLMNVSSRNIDKVYFKLLKANEDEFDAIFSNGRNNQYKLIEALTVLKKWDREGLKKGYSQSSYEEIIEGLDYGRYIVVSSNNGDFPSSSSAYQYNSFYVSDIAYNTYQELDGKKMFVRNRTSGKPLSNVKIEVLGRTYNRQSRKQEIVRYQTTTSNKEGWAKLHGERNASYSYRLSNGEDVLNLNSHDYFYNSNERDYTSERTEVFTDRAIYRPGQTLHFKTISLDVNKNGLPSVKSDRAVKVMLNDANGQEVSSLDLISNDFGSASGSITLPLGRLTGNFSLNANGTYHSFKVEEYKRPKFEVGIDELKSEVSLGDLVTINGVANALSGSPTSNAKVTYTIKRQTYYGWWSWYRKVPSSSEMIKQGRVATDDSGKFLIDFMAEADADMIKEDNPTYSYVVDVNVTDASGETRSAQKVISISALPYAYTMNLASIIDVDNLKSINVKAITPNNVNVVSNTTLKITELQQPDKWKKARNWEVPTHHIYEKSDFEKKIDRISYEAQSVIGSYAEKELVYESVITISVDGLNLDLAKYLKGGKAYKIELVSQDDFEGVNVKQTQYVATTDYENDKYPVVELLYVNTKSSVANVGERYEVKIGTSDKELTVYYYIVRDERIVHRGVANVANDYAISYMPTEEDRGGVMLYLDYVKHNFYKEVSKKIELPWTIKQLDVELITKRDKVLPGSKEEWILKISGKNKDKTIAEVLATMYDASLDQFVVHNYSFNPYVSHFGRINSRVFGFENGDSGNLNSRWNRKAGESVNWPILPILKGVDYGYGNSYGGVRPRSSRKSTMRSYSDGVQMEESMESVTMSSVKVGDVSNNDDYDTYEESEVTNKLDETSTDSDLTQKINDISIRKNLDESVFFYPNLKTDKEGNLLISFTMNEALTTWKLLTLAHDKELRYGMISHEVKTQKDVMILPNAPRFLREGDRLMFPATISNLSNNDINTTATLELIDPETDAVINSQFGVTVSERTIVVARGVSQRVDWEIQVPKNYKNLIKYRVTVRSGEHTDGEENILPVVTNQVLLTETKVISVKGGEQKKVNFDALTKGSSSAVSHKYTFEYTSHPIWYAVQALPYLMEYPHQCTEQIFNRMYANALASHIANTNPKIKSVFDKWRSLDSDALVSNLEKNESLKSALIEETPWVRDAKSETEQKKRIALLFDLNKMASETNAVIDELTKRQMASGGFSWFSGGRENVYITQNIVEGIAHLKHLGVLSDNDQRLMKILNDALRFLDEKSAERYTKLKDRINKYGGDINKQHLDQLSIHYLYIRSFFGNKEVSISSQKAYDYYMGQSEKYWIGNGLYLESMIGLTLLRNDSKVYKDIEQSLTERSFYSEELGRYWNIGNGFNWYELPIESHAMLIEFFTESNSDKDFVEDMKIWLLKNKQANHWKTTKATSAAIYSLLIMGEGSGMIPWIEETKLSEIKIGGALLDQSSLGNEAGTGYIKKTWNSAEIKPELGHFYINNVNESISWGAAYYQYFEDLDKVENFDESPLKISRNLFKEEMTNNGPQLVSLESESINPGDKVIVRIVINVDRNMSYVHLKDMRGSGFEPENVLSGYRWKGGLGYYESTKDLASHFFISRLNKGTYVFEYAVRAVHKGDFSSGIASVQCMYAPEFVSHSKGNRVVVE